MPAPKVPLVQAQDSTIGIDGVRVLHNVTFELHEREIMCVVGENGSGKSLLLQLLAGRYRPSAGRLTFRPDVNVFQISVEQVRANGILTVREFLDASPHEDRPDRLEAVMHTYRLEPTQPVRTISSGERQRLLLAAAALAQFSVTLFDLPVSELDSDGFDCAEDLIRSLTEAGGAVVVATTNPELVLRLDDCSLYRMKSGTLEPVRLSPYA